MSRQNQTDSLHPPSNPEDVERHFDFTCPNGHAYIGKSGAGCPLCKSSGAQGAEMTKKVDEPDLVK